MLRWRGISPDLFAEGAAKKSDFFRDIATSAFMRRAEGTRGEGVNFDLLMSIFDRSILQVENQEFDLSFSANIRPPRSGWLRRTSPAGARSRSAGGSSAVAAVARMELDEVDVGRHRATGRSKLPFPQGPDPF